MILQSIGSKGKKFKTEGQKEANKTVVIKRIGILS